MRCALHSLPALFPLSFRRHNIYEHRPLLTNIWVSVMVHLLEQFPQFHNDDSLANTGELTTQLSPVRSNLPPSLSQLLPPPSQIT